MNLYIIAGLIGLIGFFVVFMFSYEIYGTVKYGPFYPMNPFKRLWMFAVPEGVKKEGSWYRYRKLLIRYNYDCGEFQIYKKEYFDYLCIDYAKSLRQAKEQIDNFYKTCLYKNICCFFNKFNNEKCSNKNICLKNNFIMGKSREMIDRGLLGYGK